MASLELTDNSSVADHLVVDTARLIFKTENDTRGTVAALMQDIAGTATESEC